MKTSIEKSRWPLVFPVHSQGSVDDPRQSKDVSALRLRLRALEGMQKEAVVCVAGDATWRMVSDEGPYLNGTDLAPFPLAFFTAGQQFSLLSSIARIARQRDISYQELRLKQDNFYEMNGSFLRGDATGGAMSPDLLVDFVSEAPADSLIELVQLASAESAGHALSRDPIHNLFSLTLNGEHVPLSNLSACKTERIVDPQTHFEAIRPENTTSTPGDIIVKTRSADRVEGVEGGVGSSLKAEQRRTLHVHGEAHLKDGLRMETEIQLVKPIGSNFRFLADETRANGGAQTAPSPLAYLSAGIGFCFLTQMGRYAHIARQPLTSYRMVQHNGFRGSPTDQGIPATRVQPVETYVFLDGDINQSDAGRMVEVGERTCFLHAAMRGSFPPNIRIARNGDTICP